MKIAEYLLEKIVLFLGFIIMVIPQIIRCLILEIRDSWIDTLKMNRNEIYFRIRRVLIIILVLMVIFSFVAVINLTNKLEDIIGAQNVLIEYIK